MSLGSTQPLEKMSARNISEDKGGRCVRLTTSSPSHGECHEIWEPKPPGTLWATPGLLRDCFFLTFSSIFCTCFEQPSAHHQENQLYQYIIWYVSLCVGECLVCRYGGTGFTRQSPTRSDLYQMMYWYNWFSWWWALGCSKHVEKWNK
jgi:hypothetical protein